MSAHDEEAPRDTSAGETTALLRLRVDQCKKSCTSSVLDWLRESLRALKRPDGVRTLIASLVAAMLVCVGVAMGMKLEGWDFITSLYFVVQIVTTIGYGDFTPKKDRTKVCCAVYILCSLVVIAYVLNLVVQHLARMHSNFFRRKLTVLEAVVFRHASADDWNDEQKMADLRDKMKAKYGRFNRLIVATLMVAVFVAFGTIFFRTYEACTCSFGKTRVPGCRSSSRAECMITGGHTLNWGSAFYMSVVTLTTVGFGDHTPKTQLGRGFAIFWMLFGVASMANWVAKLSEFFLVQQLSREDFVREEITQQTFKAIDTDGDGHLSRSEYRSYVLVRHGFISQMDLDIIDRHYDLIDNEKNEKVTLAMIQRVHSKNLSGLSL